MWLLATSARLHRRHLPRHFRRLPKCLAPNSIVHGSPPDTQGFASRCDLLRGHAVPPPQAVCRGPRYAKCGFAFANSGCKAMASGPSRFALRAPTRLRAHQRAGGAAGSSSPGPEGCRHAFHPTMRLNKPVSSFSTWPSLSFNRPASAFRRRCSQILGQNNLADSFDNRVTPAE